MGDIEKSIEAKDFEKVAKLAHQLRGSSGNLRIKSIYDLAMELEKSALKYDVEESEKMFAKAKKLFY